MSPYFDEVKQLSDGTWRRQIYRRIDETKVEGSLLCCLHSHLTEQKAGLCLEAWQYAQDQVVSLNYHSSQKKVLVEV